MLKSIKAVEKKRAYEDVVVQIRALIDDGRLRQGDQLPTERDLGATFKVSRATIREAMRTLESMKLVQSRQGDGTYVLASNEEKLIQPLADALFSEKDHIRDIFYVRRIIEPHIAELAANNATHEEISKLAVIITKHEECVAEGKSGVKYDTAFHCLLGRMSKNPVLERLLSALNDLLEETRDKYLQDDERARKSILGHHEIFAAVKKKDYAAARKAMNHHLNGVETIVLGKKKRKGGGKR
jgi:GntR family transcriptional repressor for pyruvate dehydrogenase complex